MTDLLIRLIEDVLKINLDTNRLEGRELADVRRAADEALNIGDLTVTEVDDLCSIVNQINDLEEEIGPNFQDATIIAESAFEDYAQELAEELAPDGDLSIWPLRHIDWETATEELREDWQHIEINERGYRWQA
jgi:hypothetical protein